MNKKLTALFNIQAGEERLVLSALSFYFLLGCAFNLTQAVAFSLFLSEFAASNLSYVYISNAFIVTAITYIYISLGKRIPFTKLLILNLGFVFLLLTGFRIGLGVSRTRWLVFALPILFQVVVNLENIAFWTLVGRLFNVRQGKRLFGLVGNGSWIAVVITGFLISPLATLLGLVNLLLIAALCVVGALGLILYINRSYSKDLTDPPEKNIKGGGEEKAPSFFKNRSILLIFSLVLLWWIGFVFVDNLFYIQASIQYTTEEQLAGFLGNFLAMLGIVTLLNNFLSGRVISRFGVRGTLLILPIMLVAVTTAMALVKAVGAAAVILFWLAVLTKLIDMSIGFSFDRANMAIVYQPLPPEQRSQAQTTAEGVVQNVANGLAGLSLLAINAFYVDGTVPLIYALLIIVLAWTILALLLGRAYLVMLGKALTRRWITGTALSFDSSSLVVLRKSLTNPNPSVALYALNHLASEEPDKLVDYIPDLLTHPASEVRQEALGLIENTGVTEVVDKVRLRLHTDPVPTVRAAALCALGSLGAIEISQDYFSFLEDPDPSVRLGAFVAGLKYGHADAVKLIEDKLFGLVSSPDPADRVLAAKVIGRVAAPALGDLLKHLLMDGDSDVRRSALDAARQARYAQLWPYLITELEEGKMSTAVIAALASGGDNILPLVKGAMNKYDQNAEVLTHFARLCSRISSRKAGTLLLPYLNFPDTRVRTIILGAMSKCGLHIEKEEQDKIQHQIHEESALATWILSAQTQFDLSDHKETGSIKGKINSALEDELALARKRIFSLLSFIFEPVLIWQIKHDLDMKSDEKSAYAMEMLDINLSPGLKPLIFPLLEELTTQQRLDLLKTNFSQPQLDWQQYLRQLITGDETKFNPWIRAYTIHLIGEHHLPVPSLIEAVVAAQEDLKSPDLIRETAAWTLAKMSRESVSAAAPDSGLYATGADEEQSGISGNNQKIELSSIEKVLILKKINLFSDTPEEILLDVAAVLQEVELPAGQSIFDKDDPGDCMYAIIDGKVKAHDGDIMLNYLSAGEFFGEMALLDTAPRLASVTAIEDTHLLRLGQASLYELMEERIEILRSIIQALSEYLRLRVQDLNNLKQQLQGSGIENDN